MRNIDNVGRLSAGAIGPPGQRRFFVHVDGDGGGQWFLMEKQQAAYLAEVLIESITAAGHTPGEAPPADLPPVEPDEIEFRVGSMAITPATETGVAITFMPVEGEEAEPVTFEALVEQVDGMTQAALAAVAGGRPPCPRRVPCPGTPPVLPRMRRPHPPSFASCREPAPGRRRGPAPPASPGWP